MQAAGGTALSTDPQPDGVPPDPAESPPAPDATVAEQPVTARRSRRGVAIAIGLALLVIALDTVSKALVVANLSGRPPRSELGGAVYLVLVRNSGAAFSLGAGVTPVFTLIVVIVIVAIVRFASRLRSLPWSVALGLVLGGAVGNLADRIFRSPGVFRGAVVDWISVASPDGGYWPIFNLADASIVCGGIGAVLLMLGGVDIGGTRSRHSGSPTGDDPDRPGDDSARSVKRSGDDPVRSAKRSGHE